jgi:hypothetical protein
MIPAPMMTTSAVCFTRVAPSSLTVATEAQLRLPMAESMAYYLGLRWLAQPKHLRIIERSPERQEQEIGMKTI